MAAVAVGAAAAAATLLLGVGPAAQHTVAAGRVVATIPAATSIAMGPRRHPGRIPSSQGPVVLLTAGAALLAAGTALLLRASRSPSSASVTECTILASTATKAPPANLAVHLYDHCPSCNRVELFLGWNNIKYERVVYGCGDREGPTKLIGRKEFPILTGDGVPYAERLSGLPDSLEIIKWISKEFNLPISARTERKDYTIWQKKAKSTVTDLVRPRLLKAPFRDFAAPEDSEYSIAKWASKGFSVEEAMEDTPQLLLDMEELLKELEPLIQGDASLNPGGLGMDDIFLLPDLRRLTVVKDLKWPAKVRHYVDKALDYPAMQCVPYTPWAF